MNKEKGVYLFWGYTPLFTSEQSISALLQSVDDFVHRILCPSMTFGKNNGKVGGAELNKLFIRLLSPFYIDASGFRS